MTQLGDVIRNLHNERDRLAKEVASLERQSAAMRECVQESVKILPSVVLCLEMDEANQVTELYRKCSAAIQHTDAGAALLIRLEAAEEDNATLRSMLEEVQHCDQDRDGCPECHWCGGQHRHRNDCELNAILNPKAT